MPVPRRFDRRPPERDQTRTNERIRVPEVRLVGEDGKQIGVIKTSEALAYAQERDLDLVEVAPDARPPVCRVLDYSKYKYEQAQKQKQARKHQQNITIREIKFRPKIAQNDYDTKKGHVQRFLKGKDRVKVTIMFRGREVTHPERGTALLEKLAEELSELAVVEQRPIQDGRNMTMMLAPSKAALSGEVGGSGDEASADADGAAAKTAGAGDEAGAGSKEAATGSRRDRAAADSKREAAAASAKSDSAAVDSKSDSAPGDAKSDDAASDSKSPRAAASPKSDDAPADSGDDAADDAEDDDAPRKKASTPADATA